MTNNLTIAGTYGTGDKVITLKMQNAGGTLYTASRPEARVAEAELLAEFLRENLPAVTLAALSVHIERFVTRTEREFVIGEMHR